MAMIFCLSTDIGSATHTSLLVEPFLRWMVPSISPRAIDEVHFLLRKAAHLSAYAVLALLCYRALASGRERSRGAWNWATAAIALLLAVSYAASDEFHQSFIPSRTASVRDVLIDTCGAIIALSVMWAFTARKGTAGELAADESIPR